MKLTKKRGFSLVELMVVVAIMGTLAAIAIPAYNEYRKSAKKTAYRSDLLSLHKGWLAFGVEQDSFCERDTSPTQSSLDTIGMQSIYSSKLYGTNPGKENFIGFKDGTQIATTNEACSFNNWDTTDNEYKAGTRAAFVIVTNSPTDTQKKEALGIAKTVANAGTACKVNVEEYKMGVSGHISGDKGIAFNIDNNGVVKEISEGTLNPAYVQASCS